MVPIQYDAARKQSQLNKSFQLDGELDIVLKTALSIPKKHKQSTTG